MRKSIVFLCLALLAACEEPARPATPEERAHMALQARIAETARKAEEARAEQIRQKGECVLTLELSQSHFTVDIFEHIKDAANKVTLDIPTTCNFAAAVHPGDDLMKDGFRVGSFLVRSSIGNWHLKVLGVK